MSRGGVGSGGRVSGVKFSKSASLDGFVTGGKPKAKYADGFTSIVAIKASASLQWPCFLVRCRVSTFEPFTRICRCLHCILHSRRGGRFMTTALTAAAAAAVVVAAVVVEAGARTVDLRVRRARKGVTSLGAVLWSSADSCRRGEGVARQDPYPTAIFPRLTRAGEAYKTTAGVVLRRTGSHTASTAVLPNSRRVYNFWIR